MRSLRSKHRPSCSMMTELPADILLSNLFLRLPAKSIARFRCVCKSWCCYLTDPKFVRRHNNHISKLKIPQKILTRHSTSCFITSVEEDQEPVHVIPRKFPKLTKKLLILSILGSANGFVLVELHFKKLVIWNPATGDYKMVPNPNNPPYNSHILGFGYDSSIDDYKIVRIVSLSLKEVDIYSLKSNSWRRIQKDFPKIYNSYCPKQPYAVDRFVFWMLGVAGQSSSAMILSFDVKEDKIRYLPLPPRDGRMLSDSKLFLHVTIRRLVVLEVSYSTGQVNKWVVGKKVNNKQRSGVWVPVTMIVPSQPVFLPVNVRPLCSMKNGKFLMCVDHLPRLLLYDPESCLLNDFPIDGIGIYDFNQHVMYVETLVSPNAWEG